VSSDHLRVGYDEENSRRVGKLLARILGTSPRPEAPAVSESEKTAEPVRLDVVPVTASWQSEGASVIADQDGIAVHRLIEAAQARVHHVERSLTGLTPGSILLLSFRAKAIGARGIQVELRSTRRAGGYCDLPGGTAQRDGDMLDAGLDPEPDGWWRCWIAMAVDQPGAILRLSLLDAGLNAAYVGDGRSGVVLGDVDVRETSRFLATAPSPW
jgi:hypothetical protein